MNGMKRNITLILAVFCMTIGLLSCSDDSYPENPTLVSPVSGLILEVNGTDYVAIPQLQEDGSLSPVLLLAVNQPSVTATVKQIDIADPSASVNIKAGDVITFKNNQFTLEWTKGTQKENYLVEMSYNPPPVMYMVMSGEPGNYYGLNTETAQTIASITYDHLFEGYVDLTNTNWNNIGFVASGQSVYYDVSTGLASWQSYGTLTMVEKTSPGTGYFPCDGPWGDWTTTAGNSSIVSPGIWKINFNLTTREMTLLETQWAVTGTAAGGIKAMTYHPDTRKWSLTADLSAGKLKFATIPVNTSDPTVTYGASDGISKLAENGTDITVDEAGTYRIELDLSTPFYDYSITK